VANTASCYGPNLRESYETLRTDKDSVLGKTELFSKKDRGDSLKTAPRTKSREREGSPLQPSKTGVNKKRQSYLANMEVTLKTKKCLPKNMLLNFKKSSSKGRTDCLEKEMSSGARIELKEKDKGVKN
jgi:hypothetical protein